MMQPGANVDADTAATIRAGGFGSLSVSSTTTATRARVVLAALIAAKMPQSVAGLAVEHAVQVFKSKLAKVTLALIHEV